MKKQVSTYLAIILFSAQPYNSYAAPGIDEKTSMNFGIIQIPSSQEYVTIPADGSSPTGTGTIIDNNYERGEYKINGLKKNDAFTLNIQNINTGASGATLSNFTGLYDNLTIPGFPIGGLTESKKENFYLGATLTYDNTAQYGEHTASFDIVLTLE